MLSLLIDYRSESGVKTLLASTPPPFLGMPCSQRAWGVIFALRYAREVSFGLRKRRLHNRA
jgi:hypothetical protein